MFLKKLKKRIRLELSPFGFFRNYILFPVAGFLRIIKFPLICSPFKKIEEVKKKHLNDRCFILATGPSLNKNDVELLKNEKTIAINTIFKMFNSMDWKPTYYVMTDPNLFAKIQKANNLNLDDLAVNNCFVNALNKKISNGNKTILINNCWLDHIYHYGKSKRFKYKDNLLFGVYDYYSVTQECIVYAMYMGFKEIYILGADNDYLGDKQHFDKVTGEVQLDYEQALIRQNVNDWGYEYLAKIAKKKNVKVINVTRGGKLEAFERKNLEDVLNMR